MLIYLDQAPAVVQARHDAESRALTRYDQYDALVEGAVPPVRPKMMTVVAKFRLGWFPIDENEKEFLRGS